MKIHMRRLRQWLFVIWQWELFYICTNRPCFSNTLPRTEAAAGWHPAQAHWELDAQQARFLRRFWIVSGPDAECVAYTSHTPASTEANAEDLAAPWSGSLRQIIPSVCFASQGCNRGGQWAPKFYTLGRRDTSMSLVNNAVNPQEISFDQVYSIMVHQPFATHSYQLKHRLFGDENLITLKDDS